MPIKYCSDSNQGVSALERCKDPVGLSKAPIVGIVKVTKYAQMDECYSWLVGEMFGEAELWHNAE